MINAEKYLEMLKCGDEELDILIDSMSEKDAKDFVKFVIKFFRSDDKQSTK